MLNDNLFVVDIEKTLLKLNSMKENCLDFAYPDKKIAINLVPQVLEGIKTYNNLERSLLDNLLLNSEHNSSYNYFLQHCKTMNTTMNYYIESCFKDNECIPKDGHIVFTQMYVVLDMQRDFFSSTKQQMLIPIDFYQLAQSEFNFDGFFNNTKLTQKSAHFQLEDLNAKTLSLINILDRIEVDSDLDAERSNILYKLIKKLDDLTEEIKKAYPNDILSKEIVPYVFMNCQKSVEEIHEYIEEKKSMLSSVDNDVKPRKVVI